MITESEITENRTAKINETEEETSDLITYKNNKESNTKLKEKEKEKDKINLWSKLKGLWS